MCYVFTLTFHRYLEICSFFIAACLGYILLMSNGALYSMAAMCLTALVIFLFLVRASLLPVIFMGTLLLSNGYRSDIALGSFYVRFLVMGLILFRGAITHVYVRTHGANNTPSPMNSTTFGWILLLGIMGLIQSPLSTSPSLSIQRSISFILLLLVCFVYFPSVTKVADDCKTYMTHLWKVSAYVVSIGLVALTLGLPGMYTDGRLRLLVANPNQLGHWIALLLPVWIWMIFSKEEKFKTWWIKALGILSILAMLLSGSRGALISATIAVFIQCALCYRAKLGLIIGISALIFGIHFLSDQGPVVQQSSMHESDLSEVLLRKESLSTGSGRLDVWQVAFKLFQKKPIIGYGFGVTENLFRDGYFSEVPKSFQGGHVHNGYLEKLMEMGVGGLFVLLMSILTFLAIAFKKIFLAAHKNPLDDFSCTLLCIVVAGLISNFFESWITSVGSLFAFPFWFSVSLFLLMVNRYYAPLSRTRYT